MGVCCVNHTLSSAPVTQSAPNSKTSLCLQIPESSGLKVWEQRNCQENKKTLHSVEHLGFPVSNQIHFAAWILYLFVCLASSKNVGKTERKEEKKRKKIPKTSSSNHPAWTSSFVCVSLQVRIPLMMIKGLGLFQSSAIVATKRLNSLVCIKVYNWEACKLAKSVSCNFSDSKEGVCNENGWLDRILKPAGDCSQTPPTLQEVERTLSLWALADGVFLLALAAHNPVKSNVTGSGEGLDLFFQGKHRDFFLLAPDEASPGVVVNHGMDGLMGGPGSPAREQGCPSNGIEPLSPLVCPLGTHVWLSCPF